ncbi:integrase catalytic domain-containing protein [Trichonephila clavipes]|nr:integrase catalytic domain-containing protein [Trichonephila clavipes]
MEEAGMEMRKWISNDTVLMAQWVAEGFDTHPMDASIRIPRLVLDSTNDEVSDLIEIHIFCDASKLAYGAAAYVKVRKQNEVLVNLITSKTRVAPLKAVTLPRLELLGALVAARLSSRVQEIVRKKKECKVFHWTDSKIVLFWIKGSSKRWKQFVANRVQEISELTDPDSWFHCSGQDNPSDFLSRGLSVDTLISNNKWWTGPAFLRTDELPKTVSECPELNEVDYLPELKSKDSKEHTVLTLNFNQTFFDHLLSRSNKFLTIVRVLSFLYRFLFNIRNPTNKKTGPLTSDEMKEAEIYLMKQVQLSSFYKEIRAMQNGDDICNKSKILNLSPFLDDKGIIRVGGRLKHSRLPYSSKHPILLPAKSKLTIIIVKYYHEKYFHLGPQHLLYQVRLKYWPIHGRNICRKVVHNCVICFKFNPKICSQKMGDLPKERITPDKVFNSTGIDLCGPFFIKNKYQRKGPEIKVYVCIFICLVTKAIHLEIISDLTSQALIAALKRFISRRGKCHKIFSDNGTNMIGANREIKALSKLVRDREESLFAFFAEEGIEWSFIPPRSPNWGGLWEANIKSLKYHFKRVAGNSKFSYEELLTLITQIEAILNSRPLTPLTSDVDDLEVLTPAHFLIGRPITAIVEPSLLQCDSNRLNVWQRITKSVQTIWKRWSLSYLNSLQQRKKWIVNKENLKLGDMVLIREENLPPCKWLLGRVVKIYMGKDKKVRVVDIKTGKGIYKRSINRLSILPIEN